MLHVNVVQLMRKHCEHGTANSQERFFKKTPKNFRLPTKLSSKDKFFMTQIKLRLGLLVFQCFFGISYGLCTRDFYSWILSMAEYFQSFVYMSYMETIFNMFFYLA